MSISNAQASVAFLSGADDLLSRLLLDYSIFEEPKIGGRQTGKINKHLKELRISQQEVDNVQNLVRDLRSGTLSVTQGLDTLLAIPSVKAFTNKWDDVPLFSNHAKRYILAFRPDCGIAFHETDRYKNPRAGVSSRAKKNLAAVTSRRDPASFIEVGVFATRDFKKGEVINLRGGVADLTEEEDDEMRLSGGRSDFSVLWSERKNCFCLLLGPARFVNHDCRNNVEFQLVGANMTFRVLEDIKKDEELFTHYGAHYFETDNAACLCATCEQLKQGAFTPASKRKKPVIENVASPESSSSSRKRRNSSPGPRRTSSRASKLPEINYNESGPIASTSTTVALARTNSSLVSSKSPSRSRPSSSRMNPVRGALSVVDALRSEPRTVVQPKLPPPPGYGKHYTWDPKKRVCRYVGPSTCTSEEDKRKPKPRISSLPRSSSAPSLVVAHSNNKRRRLETDSPVPSTNSPRPKRPRTSQVQLKKVRLGERKSGRLSTGNGTASARDRTFARLEEALGQVDSSDLSEEEEEEESDPSEVEDEVVEEALRPSPQKSDKGKGKETAAVKEETTWPTPFSIPLRRSGRSSSSTGSLGAATPSVASDTPSSSSVSGNAHLRSVTLDLGFSTSTPTEEPVSPMLRVTVGSDEDVDMEHDHVVLCPVPTLKKGAPPPPPDKPRRSIPSPNFYPPPSDGGQENGGGGSSSNGNKNGNGKTSEGSSFCEAPSSATSCERGSETTLGRTGLNGSTGGGGSGGDGGDDGDERKKGKSSEPVDKVDGGESEEKEDKDEAKKRAGKGAKGEQEDPDAVAALLMLLTAPDTAPSPNSAAATPPSASSLNASTTVAQAVAAIPSSTQAGKRVVRSDEEETVSSAAQSSSNPRSTRRRSRLDESPITVEASPPPRPKAKKPRLAADTAASTSASTSASESSVGSPMRSSSPPRKNIRWGKGKPGQRPPHLQPPPRPVSAPPLRKPSPPPREPSPPPPPPASRPSPRRATPVIAEKRQTRSRPIPGRLVDVLSAPETLAATGGYDWEKGRYISKLEQARAPSSNPRPDPREGSPSLSPPPVPRRRSTGANATTSSSAPPAPLPPQPPRSESPATTTAASTSNSKVRRRGTSASPHPTTIAATRAPASPSTPTTTVPPDGVRATRRSFPIAAPLREIIYSSSALAATGGWDEESGRYIGASSVVVNETPAHDSAARASPLNGDKPISASSRRRSQTPASSSSTSNVKSRRSLVAETPPPPPAPTLIQASPTTNTTASTSESNGRSTRRSNPIPQRLEELVYSAAIGGWDPVQGKYISTVAARKEAEKATNMSNNNNNNNNNEASLVGGSLSSSGSGGRRKK